MSESTVPHFEAVVIGAGITGIYMVYKLQNAGFSVKGFETGSDVGGTWHWNRYPGCRLDTESFTYGYFFLKDIVPDWNWTERFASQPDLLRFIRLAADRMDVRKNIQFNTSVTSAIYDQGKNTWNLELDDGTSATCTFLLTAVGILSATRLPAIDGVDSFEGISFHTSRWPANPDGGTEGKKIAFEGKRVGVMGTGSTGVQLATEIAKTAKELFVFQRQPNWCTPLRNAPISDEEMEQIRHDRAKLLEHLKSTPVGFIHAPSDKVGGDDTPEEREAFLERLYHTPGFGIWLSNYSDLITNRDTNDFITEFIKKKIRSRINDPKIAEKLIPKHRFATKRIPMESNYYEIYNQDNVHLVDVREDPIKRIVSNGIETGSSTYDLDILIYATGFDAITGGLDRIDIRGKGGVSLAEMWDDGPVTYLGLQIAGFPNLFTLVGPHNGATFCNVGVCGGLLVEWVAEMLEYMRDHKLNCSEANVQAQEKWTAEVYNLFEQTLLTEGDEWWVKIRHHPNGTVTKRALAYLGGGPAYRQICDESARNGYTGFELSRCAS